MGGNTVADVFLRKASGLVREVAAKDVVFYNTGGINTGIGIAYVFLLSTAFYPGANHLLALAVCAVFCVIQTLTYLFFTMTMPRSGGEYMFISRTLHPSLGFSISFSYALMMLFYSAFAAAQFGSMGLSSMFQTLSVRLGNQSWLDYATYVESAGGSFLIGTVLLVAFGFILVREMKTYLKIQMVTFVIALLGILAIIWVLMTSSRETFVAAFNAYAGSFMEDPNPYQYVINLARENGYQFGGFSWSSTWASIVWPFFALAFGAQSASFAGEIRKVGRSQLVGTTGAVALAAMLMFIIVWLSDLVMGWEFLGAIAYLSWEVPEAVGPVTPWFHFLASLLTQNPVLLGLIILGWIFWSYYWVPVNMLYVTRVVFAWSFDRLAPASLGEVHPRYHTPVNTTALATVISIAFLALIVFTPYLQTLVGIVTMTLTFVITGFAAMVFPYVRPHLFERSPVRYRFLGIPVMSILGTLTAVFMALVCYRLLADDVVGANTPESLAFVFGQIVLGFILFFAMKAYRMRKDQIDVMLAFNEIPSE
jgi:amino acid transporter